MFFNYEDFKYNLNEIIEMIKEEFHKYKEVDNLLDIIIYILKLPFNIIRTLITFFIVFLLLLECVEFKKGDDE